MAGDRKRLLLEITAFLVVVALIVAFSVRRRQVTDRHADLELLMGTVVSVTVFTPDAATGQDAIEAAFDEIRRIEALTTRYSDGSEISTLNARTDGYVDAPVSREVAVTVARSLAVAEASAGAFDVTVAPLVDLWAFADDPFVVPEASAVEAALEYVDWRAVQVDTASLALTVRPGVRLDLDGVVKGHAVDRAVAVLVSSGIGSAVVDAGGDVRLLGSPPSGEGWRVGIKHPREEGLLGVVTLDGGSVATSGDYQRFVEVEGARYHHILDPATGWPSRGVMSATVVAELCVDADAFATAVFVLGAEDGMALVERTPGVEALVVTGVDEIDAVLVSSGLAGRYESRD